MNKLQPYTPELAHRIRGNVEHEDHILQRTSLHVDFGTSFVPAEPLSSARGHKKFNAIGSLCVGTDVHLPVLDVDGGANISAYRGMLKAVVKPRNSGSYTPDNNIRELLADHGIDAEIFSETSVRYSQYEPSGYYGVNKVSALVLRTSATRVPVFEAFNSTINDGGHLYINTPFSETDHTELLSELQQLGIVGERWTHMAGKDGMSVLRTPWTEKVYPRYKS